MKKRCGKCIILFVYLLIKENLYLKSYFSGSTNGIGTFIRESLCARAYTWSNTSIKEKLGLSAGGGAYSWRNMALTESELGQWLSSYVQFTRVHISLISSGERW